MSRAVAARLPCEGPKTGAQMPDRPAAVPGGARRDPRAALGAARA
jgi:hypothetical protein